MSKRCDNSNISDPCTDGTDDRVGAQSAQAPNESGPVPQPRLGAPPEAAPNPPFPIYDFFQYSLLPPGRHCWGRGPPGAPWRGRGRTWTRCCSWRCCGAWTGPAWRGARGCAGTGPRSPGTSACGGPSPSPAPAPSPAPTSSPASPPDPPGPSSPAALVFAVAAGQGKVLKSTCSLQLRIALLPPDCMIASGGCYGHPAAGVEKQTIHWVMSASQLA